ncbi:hypothetical protein EJ07DRAFT_158447 [Lizonia empirigonia]|nr:hypothetical protein EJ07DRAFT_158447 [Lizonia empirigonia]
MTTDAVPSSVLVDFMNRWDIVRLIREAESDAALRTRIDIFVSIWQLAKADEWSNISRGNFTLRKGVDVTYKLARSLVDLERAGEEWSDWLKKCEATMAAANEERRTMKGNRKGFRVEEKRHIKDVARFKAAFGIKDALILANVVDVPAWYTWPKPRKELLLHHLDPMPGSSNRYTSSSGTKRPVSSPADDLELLKERDTGNRRPNRGSPTRRFCVLRFPELDSNVPAADAPELR